MSSKRVKFPFWIIVAIIVCLAFYTLYGHSKSSLLTKYYQIPGTEYSCGIPECTNEIEDKNNYRILNYGGYKVYVVTVPHYRSISSELQNSGWTEWDMELTAYTAIDTISSQVYISRKDIQMRTDVVNNRQVGYFSGYFDGGERYVKGECVEIDDNTAVALILVTDFDSVSYPDIFTGKYGFGTEFDALLKSIKKNER